MERIDVLKGIEKILVNKAYEVGHISHRADGDWQKTNSGWVKVKGDTKSKQYNKRTTAGGDGTMLTDEQVMELVQINDPAERKRRQTEMLAENKSNSASQDEDFKARKGTTISESDIEESEIASYANNINIEDGVADDYDITDVATQILSDHNIEDTDDNIDTARNAILNWLDANGYTDDYSIPTDDESEYDDDSPTDDEIYDYEDQMAEEEDKFDQYKISHPRPALSNDGHSKGLTSEKDEFENAVERFRELTDPYNDERLTALEALKQMNEERSYGKNIAPEAFTPAVESGFKKFSDWISDFAGVEKSAVRDMRTTPTVKNMGF